ncbi:MAG TPA: hypothetical protein VGF60_21680 [Xanthobacteraceae bacterium]|jgi:hypothetical protein
MSERAAEAGSVRLGSLRSGKAGQPAVAPLLLASMLALSGCTVGRLFERDRADSGQARPANYKSDIIAVLRVYFKDPTGIRGAALSEPMLQPLGRSDRYVVCLRLDAKRSDGQYAGTKEYVAVFVAGRLDQLLEAKPQQCDAAEYQPFPEAEAMTR